MALFRKSKEKEIHRLRTAGLSLAHADRLAQNRRSDGSLLMLAGGAGVLLIGAIAVLSLQMQSESAVITETTPQAAAAMDAIVAPPPPGSIAIADEQTGVPASVEAPVQTSSAPTAAPEKTTLEVTRSTIDFLNGIEPNPSEVTVAAVPEAPDCVALLDDFLSPLFLQFDLGSTRITEANDIILRRVSEKIANCDDAYVMVAGHADTSGDDAINMALSWERADETLNRLVELGVSAQSVEAIGFGARAPLAEGSDEQDGIDRRVDFRVMRRTGDRS